MEHFAEHQIEKQTTPNWNSYIEHNGRALGLVALYYALTF
jgi:hypothetical protein